MNSVFTKKGSLPIMPKGGTRFPPGGRPKESFKKIKREKSESVRFTKAEHQGILEALKIYGGRKSAFLRDTIMEKVRQIIDSNRET